MSTAEFLRAVLTVPSPVEPLAFVAEAEQPPTFYGSDRPRTTSRPEPGGILRWADLTGGGHVCWLAIGNGGTATQALGGS